jgi:serine/threonine protein phosphatase PrpC
MSGNPFERWTPTPPPPSTPEFRVEKLEEPALEMAPASRGKKNRIKNEDTAYIDPERGIFFVADGLGGSAHGGDLASKAVVESVLKSTIEKEKDKSLVAAFGEGETGLNQATVESAVRTLIGRRMHAQVKRFRGGSDTTISLGKFWTDEQGREKITVASVGDSRIYRFRGNSLERLTTDSSIVQKIMNLEVPDTEGFPIVDDSDVTRAVSLEMLKEYGKIDRDLLSMITYANQLAEEEEREVKSLTIDEMRHFVLNTVLHPSRIDVRTEDVEDGDIYLALSDGIHDNLIDEKIRAICEEHYPNADGITDALLAEAVSVSTDETNPRSKPDDMTVAVARKQNKKENKKQTA